MSEEGIPAVEPDATPEPDESSEAPQSANSDSGNYHERIRSEGEFAVEEVQKKDRYIGELHAKTNAYKPLEPFIQAVGSVDDFIELAILGDRSGASRVLNRPPPQSPSSRIRRSTILRSRRSTSGIDESWPPEINSLPACSSS